MDLLAGSQCEIEEFLLSSDLNKFKHLNNPTLAGLELGSKSGAMVLAIRDGTSLNTNPSGDVEIGPGQLLIALGSKNQLLALRRLLEDVLSNVGRVKY